MGIIDFFKQQKAVEEKAVEKAPTEEFNLQVFPLSNTETGVSNSKKKLAVNVEWVYRNAQAVSQGVSEVKLQLFQANKNDEPKQIFQHEILELLSKVNNWMTFRDLVELDITNKQLLGEYVWWLVRDNPNNPREKPREIIPLRPERLVVEPGDLTQGNFIDRYIYKVPGKESVVFMPWELLHITTTNPENLYRGKSLIDAAATTIDTDIAAAEYNRNFFWNSARPDAILTTAQRLQEDTYERLLQTWKKKFRGVKNSNKLAILESGLDYKPLQLSQRDMQFLEQQKWTRDKIMSIFGNTPIILGIVEDVNRANAEASEFVWLKHNIKPKMQRYVDALNEFLVPLYGDNLFLTFEDPIPQDKEHDLNVARDLTNKVLTVNESRAKEGLDPVEGGDVIYLPFNEVPLGSGVSGSNEPQKGYIKLKGKKFKGFKRDFSRELQMVKNRNYRLNKKAEEFTKTLDNVMRDIMPKMPHKPKPKPKPPKIKPRKFVKGYEYDVKEAFWKVVINTSETFEEQYENFLKREFYPTIEREVISNIKFQFSKKSKKKGINDFLFNKKRLVELSFLNFLPLAEKITGLQGTEALRFLDINEQFIVTDAIRDRLISNSQKSAKSVTDTSFNRIRKQLAEGLEDGEGQAKLIARTRKAVKELSKNQAKVIALSEVSRATNLGILEAYKDAGIECKEWFTALDERVCPWCNSMEGKRLRTSGAYFDLGDSLTVKNDVGNDVTLDFGFENIQAPPLHPSCRCTTVPCFDDIKGNDVVITKTNVVEKELDMDKIMEEVKEEAKKTAEKESARNLSKFEDTLTKLDEIIDEQGETEEDTTEDK